MNEPNQNSKTIHHMDKFITPNYGFCFIWNENYQKYALLTSMRHLLLLTQSFVEQYSLQELDDIAEIILYDLKKGHILGGNSKTLILEYDNFDNYIPHKGKFVLLAYRSIIACVNSRIILMLKSECKKEKNKLISKHGFFIDDIIVNNILEQYIKSEVIPNCHNVVTKIYL